MTIKKSQKLKKKSFFEVKVPMTAAKIYLYGSSDDELNGKIVKLDLTRSLRGKSLELKARVKKEDGTLIGEPVSLVLAGSYVRRMIRKGSDYVEDSFITDCRDAKTIVKLFMITRNKVSRGIRNELRNNGKDFIVSYLKNRTAREIFSEIMTNKIQRDISLKLKKIYPLAVCEIRWFEVIGKKEVEEKKDK